MFTSRLEEAKNNDKSMGWFEFIISSGGFFILTIISMGLLGAYSDYMNNITWFFIAFTMMFTLFCLLGTLLFYGFLKIDHPKYNRRTAFFSGFLQLFITVMLAPWGWFLLFGNWPISYSNTLGIWWWVLILSVMYSLLFINSVFLLSIGVVNYLRTQGEQIEIVAVEES